MFTPFDDSSADPAVRGFLHTPAQANGSAIALTHGAGANCQTKLLVAVGEALAAVGFTVLRFDLPFRLARRFGPPHPGTARQDQQGIRRAATLLRNVVAGLKTGSGESASRSSPGAPHADVACGSSLDPQTKKTDKSAVAASSVEDGKIFLAGHSYGGRQSSMLLADDPTVADGLLLLSYPLHPPNKPAADPAKPPSKAKADRSAHFPKHTKPVFFVHGTKDPFATTEELHAAVALIPALHSILEVENGAHDLLVKKSFGDLPDRIARDFAKFVGAM
jgi:uncharacterized protein